MLVFVLLRGDGKTPPEVKPPETADEEEVEYDEFTGQVVLNGEDLELQKTPLLAKGIIHLPLLELAKALNQETNLDQEKKIIFIGAADKVDRDNTANWKIYSGSTDITPANLIKKGDEFYIDAKEAAPMLGMYFYENLFANSAYLVDDTLASRDGDYVAVRKRDSRGWAPEIRITISGSRIAAVDYLELDKDGKNKFEDEEYLDSWGSANDIDPAALVAGLEKKLIDTQTVSQVDVVTGATGSWKNFTQLASAALAKAKVSTLSKQIPDGKYMAVGNPSDRGWTPIIEFTVSGGEISAYKYDERDEEGKSKREDEEYLKSWRNAYSEVDPLEIVREREENILKTQDPNLIDATTGATSWGVNIKQYTTGCLEQAAMVELPGGYDTIYVFFGEETERGDRPQLLLATVDKELVAVDFSEYSKGTAKKHNETYLAKWREQRPEVDPRAVVAEMETTFLETKKPSDLEAVSGATSWRNSFKELGARALDFIQGE